MKVWSDEPCDRTEGHKGLDEVFQERYGVKLEEWKKTANKYDGGDAMFWVGYVDLGEYLKLVEVVVTCDGNSIKELS